MVIHGIVTGSNGNDYVDRQLQQIALGDHRPDLPLDEDSPNRNPVLLPHGNERLTHGDVQEEFRVEYLPSSSQRH